MFTNAQFAKLSTVHKIWAISLFYFLPDSRLTNPTKLLNHCQDELIDDPVIYEICYYNVY